MAVASTSRRVRIRVDGTVQGVGFRPYVYRLAHELGLGGFVLNDARGVLQLGEAVRAGRGVGGDEGVGLPARVAGDDHEALPARGGHRAGVDAQHLRERGRPPLERRDEALDLVTRPLDLDLGSADVVAHEAGQAVLLGQAEDERPEPDALHDPFHAHGHPHDRHRAHDVARSACRTLACASWIRGMYSERTTMTWSARFSARIRPPS